MVLGLYSKRKGITGIETAIILTAFVITASAFSFVILNVGFLTSDKAQTTVITGMKETSSALLADAGVTGYFSNTTTADQDEVYLEEMVFYVKLAQGHEPIDCGDDSLVITYTNIRGHSVIYSNQRTNGTITTIKTITGDTDSLLEVGEKMQIQIDLTQINSAHVKPAPLVHRDVYGKPYESIRIEIRPVVGAVLTIEKEIPAVNAPVMTLR
jgi:flagellin FlaB